MQLSALVSWSLSLASALVVSPPYADVLGGQPLLLQLSATPLRVEQPRCFFGERSVAAVPLEGGYKLSCTALPAPALQPGAVTVSTNTAPNVTTTLVYYDSSQLPQLSSVTPRSSLGDAPTTVHAFGSNFAPLGESLRCAFGADQLAQATFISPGELACVSPETSLQTHSVELAVSIDGVAFSPQRTVLFTTFDGATAPALNRLDPRLGPLEGGNLVDVHGSAIAPADSDDGSGLRCFFGDLPAVPASFVSASLVQCFAPPATVVATVPVSVGVADDWPSPAAPRSTPASYTYYVGGAPRVSSVAPSFGDLSKPQFLRVSGRGFAPLAAQLRCGFAQPSASDGALSAYSMTEASFDSATELRCAAPAGLHPGATIVRASIDGGRTFGDEDAASGAGFLAYDGRVAPDVSAVSPGWSDAAGGSTLTLRGYNLAPTAGLACEFDEVGSSPASLIDQTAVTCLSPAARPQTTLVRLTLDGSRLSTSSQPFTYHDEDVPPSLLLVEPNEADTRSAVALTVWGGNFAPEQVRMTACVFESAASAAQPWRAATAASFVAADRLSCASPALPRGAEQAACERCGTATLRLFTADADIVDVAAAALASGDDSLSPTSLPFTLYDKSLPPSVSKLSPRFAAAHTGASILVTGLNFAPTGAALFCREGTSLTSIGIFVNGSAVRCPSLPVGGASDSSLAVSDNAGRSWSRSAPFTLYEPERPPTLASLEPPYVDVASPRPLTVSLRGDNFAPTGSLLQCGFGLVDHGDTSVPASFVSSGVARCNAPRVARSNLVVHARHDGERWSAAGLRLVLYNSSRPSLVKRLEPDAVALDHAATLTVIGENFFPAQRPRCRFAGYTEADRSRFVPATVAASFVTANTMRCPAPAASSPVTLAIYLSFDADSGFGASTAPLTIFDPTAPPRVFAVTPPYAASFSPVLVTLHGSNLAPPQREEAALLCRFGDQVVAASFVTGASLECSSPLGAPVGSVYVSSSADGGASWAPSSASFTFYDLSSPLALTVVSPASAGVAGGALLTLNGSNFAPAPEVSALCTFSEYGATLGATPASYVSPTQLRCASPQLDATEVGGSSLTLTPLIDGDRARGDYRTDDSLRFTFYDGSLPPQLSSLSPQGVPLHLPAPASVLVSGSNFAPDGLQCSIDRVPTEATFVRATLVRCAAPQAPDVPASMELRVTRGGAEGVMTSPPLPFSFYDADAVPATAAAVPPYADVRGGTSVLVSGEGFRPAGAGLLCRVGGVLVPATFVSINSVRCVLPPVSARWGDERTVELCVSADYGATFGACGANVTYFDPARPPTLAAVMPPYVHTDADASAPPTVLRLSGSNFAPTAELKCHVADVETVAASAASDFQTPATFVSWGEVACNAPRRAATAAAFISVTQDGTRWALPRPLTYFTPPSVLRISPAAADLRTAVLLRIEASHLFARANNLLCLLTPVREASAMESESGFTLPASLVSDDEVECSVPAAAAPRTMWVQLSTTSGLEYTARARHVRFTQYDANAPANLSAIVPRYDDLAGGVVITLSGSNFAPEVDGDQLHCAFSQGAVSTKAAATFENTKQAKCVAPMASPFAPHTVDLSLEYGLGDAHDAIGSSPRPFTYFDADNPPFVSGLTPEYADIGLRTLITVRGANFAPTAELSCSYGEHGAAAATFVSVEEVSCRSPAVSSSLVFQEVSVRVSTDGKTFSAQVAKFTYFTSPIVTEVSPPAGDRRSPHALTVRGDNFFQIPGENTLFCRFGESGPTAPARFVDAQTLTCDTPTVDAVMSASVLVSVNRGYTYSAVTGAPFFTFYEPDRPPVITSLLPPYGTMVGGTGNTVTVLGENFAPTGTSLACRWGEQIVTATFVNVSAVTCVPPASVAPETVPFSVTDSYEAGSALPSLGIDSNTGQPVSTNGGHGHVTGQHLSRNGGNDQVDQAGSYTDSDGFLGLALGRRLGAFQTMWAEAAPYTYYDPSIRPIARLGSPSWTFNPEITSGAKHDAPFLAPAVVVTGSNFVPSSRLECRFGDVSAPASFIYSSALKCLAPRRSASAHVSLCVATLAEAGEACAPFAFYDTPTLAKVDPVGVDKDVPSRLRLSGANLPPGATAACVFGDLGATAATVDSETSLECASPVHRSHVTLALLLSVSVPGVPAASDLTRASANSLPFTLYDIDQPTAVGLLLPAFGPPSGGTAVVVRGDNFAPGAICTFGDLPPTPATFYAVDHLACLSPSAEARPESLGSQLLTVADASGERRGEGRLFTYYDEALPPQLMEASPDYATNSTLARPATQANTTLFGRNFAPLGSRLFCEFGGDPADGSDEADGDAIAKVAPATFISGVQIACAAPSWAAASSVPLRVVVGSQSSTSDAVDEGEEEAATGSASRALPFHFYTAGARPKLAVRLPIGLDVAAPLPDLLLAGTNFSPVPGAQAVAFDATGVAAAAFERTGLLRVTPPISAAMRQHGGTVQLSLSSTATGGLEMLMPTPLNATYYDSRRPPDVSSLAPLAGGLAVSTALRLRGANFAPLGDALKCDLEGVQVAASFADAGSLRCAAPPLGSDGEGGPYGLGEGIVPKTVAVAASNDAGLSHGHAMPFTYYDQTQPPSVTAVEPRLLPLAEEATLAISGANFAPTGMLLCRFGGAATDVGSEASGYMGIQVEASFVSVGQVACDAPPAAAPVSAQVVVSTDGGLTWANDGVVFTRYDSGLPAKLLAVSPRASGLYAHAALSLRGANLAPTPDLMCTFALPSGESHSAATFVASDVARCDAPEAPLISTVDLRLGLTEGAWSDEALPFTFYDDTRPPGVLSASTTFGPLEGSTTPISVRGDNFAPTAALSCRFALAPGTTDGEGGVKPDAALSAATFVSVGEARCMVPRSKLPRTVVVSASTDGEAWGPSEAAYTYYDPTSLPVVSAVSPPYGHWLLENPVTIHGSNFAPTSALLARWGEEGQTTATFVSSDRLLAQTVALRDPLLRSSSVPVDVSITGEFVAPPSLAAESSEVALYTYYDPQAPPIIEVAQPVSGHCGVGGASALDTRSTSPIEIASHDVATEVHGQSEFIDLWGNNFAPTPMLTCVFRYFTSGLFSIQSTAEYWVPAVFERNNHIRCPIPTTYNSDNAHIGSAVGSAVMPFTATNDGLVYHYSNHTFEFVGGCSPTPVTITFELALLALFLALIVCVVFLARRKSRAGTAQQVRRKWVEGVMRQVGHQLYPTEDEYREALDDYMRTMGLSGEEESHYLDFLRHTMDWQATNLSPGLRGTPEAFAAEAFAKAGGWKPHAAGESLSSPPKMSQQLRDLGITSGAKGDPGPSLLSRAASTIAPTLTGRWQRLPDDDDDDDENPSRLRKRGSIIELGVDEEGGMIITPPSNKVSAVLKQEEKLAEAEQVRRASEKVNKFMRGKTLYFNGAGDAKLPSVEQAWSVEYLGDAAKAAKNREVLGGIAAILKEYPALGLQIHGETGNADTAPDRLAVKYGLHPRKDVQACMDHLAANRAAACMDALKARGIASARLVATHRARTGSLKVDFLPQTMADIAAKQAAEAAKPPIRTHTNHPPSPAKASPSSAAQPPGATPAPSPPAAPAVPQAPAASSSSASAASASAAAAPETPAIDLQGSGVLEVHVLSAEGLLAADRGGTSDPYAKVRVGDKDAHKRQTKVVPKNLNPRWDERLLFPGTLAEFVAETLIIKVRDKDRASMTDDHLGECHVPLRELTTSLKVDFRKQPLLPEPKRRKLSLDKSASEKFLTNAKGSISFTVSWLPEGGVWRPKTPPKSKQSSQAAPKWHPKSAQSPSFASAIADEKADSSGTRLYGAWKLGDAADDELVMSAKSSRQ